MVLLIFIYLGEPERSHKIYGDKIYAIPLIVSSIDLLKSNVKSLAHNIAQEIKKIL